MSKKLPHLKKFLKETQLKNAFLAIQKKKSGSEFHGIYHFYDLE